MIVGKENTNILEKYLVYKKIKLTMSWINQEDGPNSKDPIT